MLNRIFKRKSQLALVFAFGACLGLSSLGGCHARNAWWMFVLPLAT